MTALHDAHVVVGWLLIVTNGVVGAWALAAQYVEPLRRPALWWCIGVAQLFPFASAVIGVWIMNRYDRPLDQFHALYGFTTIVAVGILYSYRSSPFMRDRQHLLYGFGCLFIMGLGIRSLFLPSDPGIAGAVGSTLAWW